MGVFCLYLIDCYGENIFFCDSAQVTRSGLARGINFMIKKSDSKKPTPKKDFLMAEANEIALNLKDSGQDFFKVIDSIHKIALNLKESGQDFFKVIDSIHKIALSAKDSNQERGFILNYANNLKRVVRANYFIPHKTKIIENIKNLSSFGQLKSKMWLIDILKKNELFNLGNVFFCAGWYGLLASILLTDKDFTIKQLFNFDLDPLAVQISEDLNRSFVQQDWKFKAVLKNIFELDYHQSQFETLKANEETQKLVVSPDTIINCACEHIQPFSQWQSRLPQKKLIILQSNNFFGIKDHVNCVSSLKDFKNQAPLDLVYEGELDLGAYKRFMLIGYKK